MRGDQIIALVVAGVVVLIAILAVVGRSRGERELMALAERVHLPVPEHLEAELLRHVMRRGRAATAGFAAAFVAVFVPFALLQPDADVLRGSVLVVVAFACATAAGAAAALLDRRRGSFGSPSVGRLRGPRLADLVPPGLIIVVSLMVVVALVGAAAMPLLPDAVVAEIPPGSGALAIVAALALLAWAVAARALAHRRPIAGDTATLAWSDALRAESVRDLLLLPAYAAAYSLVGTAFAVLAAAFPAGSRAGDIVGVIPLLVPVLLIIGVVALLYSDATARHYQRRLWPELADAASRPAPDRAEGRA